VFSRIFAVIGGVSGVSRADFIEFQSDPRIFAV